MSTIKDTTVTVGGLSTFANELSGTPSGTLADCDNIVLRIPGTLQPAPFLLTGGVPRDDGDTSTVVYAAPVYATSDTVTPFINMWQMGQDSGVTGKYWLSVFDLDENVAHNYGDVTTSTTLSETRDFTLTPGDAQTSWARNRRLLTTDRGCLAWTRNTADSNYELRLAGAPTVKGVKFTSSTGGAPPDIWPEPGVAAYRVTVIRDYPNYSLESAPSTPVVVRRPTGIYTLSLHAVLDDSLDVRPGDIIVLYRTAAVDDPDGETNPGDDMQEATRATVTSADITAGQVLLVDTNRNSSLGASLYTSKEGVVNGNYPPPNAHDVCTFGDTTFYAMTQDYPIVSFSVPNLGPKSAGAAVGVSSITITTTTPGAATATVPGDQTSVIRPNMVMGLPLGTLGLPMIIDTATFGGGVTTLTFKTDGRSGYSNVVTGGPWAGFSVPLYDTITFTYNEYDGSTSSTLFVLDCDTAADSYNLPADSFAQVNSVEDGLRRIAFSRFDISVNPDGSTFAVVAAVRMTQPAGFLSFSMTATHGSGYMGMDSYTSSGDTATKASTQSTDKATLYFSKSQLPESVPPGNYFPVGHGEIQRLFSDQNSLYAACTDGLYRITGQGNDWTVVQLSKTFRLVSKNAVTQCLGVPFVWGQDGISAVNESGPVNVSDAAIKPALAAAAELFSPAYDSDLDPGEIAWLPCMSGDDVLGEVTLQLDVPTVSTTAANTYRNRLSRGGLYVLNLTAKAFYKRSQALAGARCYQPKWRTTYLFRPTSDSGQNGPAAIAWERHVVDVASGESSVNPTYEREVTREYPSRVWWRFNVFKAQTSVLKQWIDCNLLVRDAKSADITFQVGPDDDGVWHEYTTGANTYLRFLFRDDLIDSSELTAFNWGYVTHESLPRQHCLVPRRSAVEDTLRVGVVLAPFVYTLPTQEDQVSTYSYVDFVLEGFTLRYRVASDTFQV